MVVDPRFKLLSFTGSAPVGWMLKAKCGKKKVVLELGGNAAVIGAIYGVVHLLYLGEKASGADDCDSSPENCGHCGCCGKGKRV